MNILYKFSIGIWDMFLEMSPYLLLGFAFAGILHVLIPKEIVTKQIGKKNIWSILKATLLGVPLPLCSCGVIPTGVSFYKNGASKGATNAFLISTPQTGVDSILITSSLMNWPWAIMRPIVALITGVIGGLLTDKMDTTDTDIEVESCSSCSVKPKRHWLIEIIDYAFFEFLPDISRQLIVGIVIAVAITLFIPPSVFSDYLTNPFLNMLLVLVASIPLYVCATGSVPIASSLLLLGVSPGAVLVFLMAGPATNAATISVLWKALGKKATLAYLISIIGGALFFGVLIDYVLPTTWFTITESVATHIHGESTSWIAISSAILLISLILIVELKKQLPKKQIKMENSKTYTVNGMTCNHCKNSVETNLVKASTIDEAVVDLEAKSVTVKGSATSNEVKAIVDGLGFEFIS
jgi:uncharacterized membrane protein YraQ (UPF0718 family)/copper chaperone CopZ